MNIYEYQAKKIFKDFGVAIPKGIVAYTPHEAKDAAEKISVSGPWIVKAQIQAGSRYLGKFTDKRAGRRGGIRLSKSLEEVFDNANEMLENILITNKTGEKGQLVSRVYVEEYIKAVRKFYFGFVIDRISASVILLLASIKQNDDGDFLDLTEQRDKDVLKINLGLQKTIDAKQVNSIAQFMNCGVNPVSLKNFLNRSLKVFYSYDATLLDISPVGIEKNGDIKALDAKFIFDENALYRHTDILKLSDEASTNHREVVAAKFGFQYRELNNGIGIITNGSELALNIINEAKKNDLDTACFLNVKGGVDRDKIAASIRLIMSNPKVDGIFINILGGFSRCNLIADGIITVANDLGLNIPLVARFEGTNKEEAINILQNSGFPLKLATSTLEGLCLLKDAIEEDL